MRDMLRNAKNNIKKEASTLKEILNTDIKDTAMWETLNRDVLDIAADWYANNVGTLRQRPDIEAIEPSNGLNLVFAANEDGSLTEKAQEYFDKITGAINTEKNYGTLAKVAAGAGTVGLAFALAPQVGFGADNPDGAGMPWEWGGPVIDQSQEPLTVVNDLGMTRGDVYNTIEKNEAAFFGFAWDAEVNGANLELELDNPEGYKTPQNQQMWKTEQIANALNSLGYHLIPEEQARPQVEDIVARFVRQYRGKEIDPEQLQLPRGPDGAFKDVIYPDGSITGVRPGHIIIKKGESLALTPENVRPVADHIIVKTIVNQGDLYVQSGQCPADYEIDGDGICVPCEGKGNKEPAKQDSNGVSVAPPSDITKSQDDISGDGKPDVNGGKNNKVPNGKLDEEDLGARISLQGLEGLDAYANFRYTDNMWKSVVENPDENGVPMESEETAHNQDLSANAALVYMFHPNIGVGVAGEYESFGGKEKGSSAKGRLDLVLDSEYGQLRLGWVPVGLAVQNIERNDDENDLKVSREMQAGGFEGRYVSPDLWNGEQQAFLVLGYNSLNGDSKSKVEFDVEGLDIPDQKTKGDYSNDSLDAMARVLFLKTPFGPVGMQASYGQEHSEVEDGQWDQARYGIGPAMAIPVDILGQDAFVDVSGEWQWAEQDPHEDSVKESSSEGFYFQVGIRPGDRGPLY